MPDAPISVRRFDIGDAEATWRVYYAAIRRTARADYPEAALAAWAPDDVDLDEWRRRRLAARTFCAESAGTVVGFSDITADGLLDMLFVHPDSGGHGVARQLVTRVLVEAQALGLTRIDTHASRTARPAFERFGFVVDHMNESSWIRGHNLPNYDMHIDLPPVSGVTKPAEPSWSCGFRPVDHRTRTMFVVRSSRPSGGSYGAGQYSTWRAI